MYPAPDERILGSEGEVLERISKIQGSVFEFIEFCLDGRTDLSISELRDLILQTIEGKDELQVVILVDPQKVTLLGERLVAALGHARAREALGEGLGRVLVGEAVGGGGIGDVRRCWRVKKDGAGQLLGLFPTDEVLKIVERPHKNLVNTDLEVLETTLPELCAAHPDQLTPFLGVGKGLRRGEWTLVQRLTYQDPFVSFQDILSDIGDHLCNPSLIVELLRQSAEALKVLHDAGIAHRDFKADAVLVTFEPGMTYALAQRLKDLRPAMANRLYQRSIRARIYDFDTVGLKGHLKDPNRTTSSSENARIENPRELSQVFVESDQYPLGIAAMRLFPDLWGEIRGVMKHGLAVAVPMKIMGVRQTLEDRRRHFIGVYSTLYSCSETVAAELVDIVLRLIAFEPEDRFQDLGELVKRLDDLKGELPSAPLLTLIRANPALFEDSEELISGLLTDRPLRLLDVDPDPKPSGASAPPVSWWMAMTLGLVVGGGGLYLLQDRPPPTSPTPLPLASLGPASGATPSGSLIPASGTPTPTIDKEGHRLAAGSLDEGLIYQASELREGESLKIPFRTEAGLDGEIVVTRGSGEERWDFAYTASIGEEAYTFDASRVPVATLMEEVLSILFTNYCSPSDPERVRRFIRRIPKEPTLGGPSLSARFTRCDGGETVIIPTSVSRQSSVRFRMEVDGLITFSKAPRVDLCAALQQSLGSEAGGPLDLECDSIGLKLPEAAAPQGGDSESTEAEVSAPLRSEEITIEPEMADIFWAAKKIASMTDNVRVKLRITGRGVVEVIKRPGSLTYGGRVLTSGGMGSQESALKKAIYQSSEP